MIKANELRIGNWVTGRAYAGSDFDFVRVEAIDDGGINISSGYEGGIERDYYHDDIDPIYLTTEILETSGFNKEGKFFEKNEVILLCLDDTCYYYYNSTTEARTILKHVHQLQNLYFALTGEELQIVL